MKHITSSWLPILRSASKRLLALCTLRPARPAAAAPSAGRPRPAASSFPWRRTTAQTASEPDDVGLVQLLATSYALEPASRSNATPAGRSGSQFHRSSSPSSFIHIVGPQGSGKSTLAQYLILGLAARGVAAINLSAEGLATSADSAHFETIRTRGARRPYSKDRYAYPVYLVEHQDALPAGLKLGKGDRVLRVGAPA